MKKKVVCIACPPSSAFTKQWQLCFAPKVGSHLLFHQWLALDRESTLTLITNWNFCAIVFKFQFWLLYLSHEYAFRFFSNVIPTSWKKKLFGEPSSNLLFYGLKMANVFDGISSPFTNQWLCLIS